MYYPRISHQIEESTIHKVIMKVRYKGPISRLTCALNKNVVCLFKCKAVCDFCVIE